MKTIITVLFLFYSINSFSQTGYRVKQLGNVDNYLTYSALWGYTATNGREYAMLGSFEGTSFIDITDSSNIHEVDFLPTPAPFIFGNAWREMKTYSHYAYIISEADPSNLQVVDLAYLPDSIRYVGQFVFPNHRSTHSISQSGPYLYLNGGNEEFSNGVAVIDITNPEVPVLRGKWDTYYVHDSRIVNDTIWACNIGDGRITVVNAVNKDNLVTIREWIHNPVPNSPHNIAFSSNMNYAYITDEAINPSPGRMKIWDVSDLGNITYISSFNAYPFEKSIVHNVETSGNYAFLAYYSAGIKVLNISNPANPVEIGWFDTYPENNGTSYIGCWGIYYFPSGKIIASDETRGLFVLRPDLSNPVLRHPSANFSLSQLQVHKYDTLRLIDASDGIPSSWQWTVTGPENKSSTLKHPQFIFSLVGNYNVKLKVTNAMGSDSISRTDAFKVIPAPLTSFNTVSPVSNTRIVTSPNDTSKVLFSWRKSSIDTAADYKINFRKLPSGTQMFFLSGNNGRDTFSLITRSFLDSMALQFGLTGDSVIVTYRVKVFNESDSLASANTVILTLRRSSVGIQQVGTIIPGEYNLYQNYPNPFNPVTNIEFDLPQSGKTLVEVFDISGKLVLDLLNTQLDAGKYKYTIDGSNLNSGVYFVRLSVNKFSSVRKIVLLK